MKNKIIKLFDKKEIIPKVEVKYSVLLEKFMTPFASEFADMEYYDDIIEFALNAWNFGNFKAILPENELDSMINEIDNSDFKGDLLKKMIDYKVSHFKEYPNFIVDHELKETEADPILTVVTQEQAPFLASWLEEMEDEYPDEDFEENYINRCAIIVKPLDPFLDWATDLCPEDLDEIKEVRTYLVSEDIEDIEAWLKKKFDKIFSIELEAWNQNKKEWPQKRSYKMFKEWFRLEVSTMIYDFERRPVLK